MAKTNIFVLIKTSSEDDERHLQDVFIKMDVCWDVMNICSYSFIKTFKDDSIRRTFFQGKQNPLHFLRSYIMLYKISSSIKYLQDLKAHLHQIRIGQQSSSLVYSKFQWKCEQCSNRTIFEQVCHNRNCWVGFFSGIYLTRQLLGMLVGYPGFVKSNEGKHGCSKCPTNSIPNKNQTKRLKFQ